MNASAMESFLARLYTDGALRAAFLAAPVEVARRAGLDEDAVQALARIDRQGLALAADSYAVKRAQHAEKSGGRLHPARMLHWLRVRLTRLSPIRR